MKARTIYPGKAEGQAIVSHEPIGFYGGIDMKTGIVIEKGHELEGVNISGKILVFPHGKGSSVGSYVLYAMAKNGTAPLAIINKETETIIATGCVLAEIPLIDRLEKNPLSVIRTGDYVKIFKDGIVETRKV